MACILALMKKGAFKEAYNALNDLEAELPGLSRNGDIQVLRAEMESLANDDDSKVREALEKAKELGCRDWGTYYKMHGNLMWNEGKLEQAVQDYHHSIALVPHVSTMTLLAHALAELQDRDVVRVCHEILLRDPDNCDGYIYLGRNAYQCGNAGEAMRLADKARGLVRSADEFFELAHLYYELDNIEVALSLYLQADERGYVRKALLHACIAACYFSLGDLESTGKCIERAASFDPDEYVKEVLREYKRRLPASNAD